ncbi:MAG: caspase family protein [Holophaga sp.]|jgi:hypothetical protein
MITSRLLVPLACLACLTLSALPPGPTPKPAPAQGGRAIMVKPVAPVPGSERRVALVIGNGAYKDAPLKNPVNDARTMAKALAECGFEVTRLENARRQDMRQALRDFAARIEQGGTGLFYFAGHGMAVKGRNYLIPVDADVQSEDEVEDQALAADAVLAKMEAARNRVNVVILDACRNNPFARSFRSAARGLAQMDAPAGSIIAYATAPGSVAADGGGGNGLYTKHLLQALQEPGLKVEEVFKRVRVAVKAASSDQQVPWDSSSLTGDFYFRPPASLAAASSGSSPGPLAPPPTPAQTRASAPGEDLYQKGMASYLGTGIPQNYREALACLIQAADRNHAAAQAMVGRMYHLGLGTPANPVQALRYYRSAAEQDDPMGQNGVGAACAGNIPGCGLEPDPGLALAWFTKAADQDFPVAHRNLGRIYAQGIGVPKDEARAFLCYQKALKAARPLAERGDPDGQVLMGYLCRDGEGMAKDDAQAADWFRKAADQGSPLGQTALGVMHLQGRGVPKDAAQAVAWYRKAADQGYAEAQNELGVCYWHGYGVAADPAEATRWYRKAADQGERWALNNLGAAYFNGQGVPQDQAEAVVWYRKAAELGFAAAQNNLGACYLNGTGVAKDQTQAVAWFRKGAAQGEPWSENNLGFCLLNGYGVAKDYGEALAWFRKAAEHGQGWGHFNLAYMCENGLGVAKDLNQALAYYRKAAELGIDSAKPAIQRLTPH